MAITRKVNSDIEITEARGDEDVSRCSLTRSKLITVGEMRVTTKDTRTPQRLTFFSKPPHEDKGSFLMAIFSSTPEMASSKATSQAPRRRSSCLFTIFHQEITAAPPPSQLGGHPPRVTSLRSLTRTNRNGELNTMQGCKARTQREVLKSFSLKSHQINKC